MKVLAINITKNYGISKKKDPNGKEYEMCALQILTPFESGSGKSENGGTWNRTGYGLVATELPARPDCIEQFKDVKFPAMVEVITDSAVVFGRMTTVVTGLSVAPVKAAA